MLAPAWPRLVRLHPELTSDDFVMLATLLARGPGRDVMRQKGERPHVDRKTRQERPCKRRTRGLADWLGWPRQRVWRSITRLNASGLVWGVLYQQGDQLPTGKPARTNVVRYVVRVERIRAGYDPDAFAGMESRPLNGPPGGSGSGPSLGSPGSDSTCTPKPPRPRRAARARRGHEADAAAPPEDSRGAAAPRESEASETPPSADAAPGAFGESADAPPEAPAASREGEHDACREAFAAVATAWDALRMPEAGGDRISRCRPTSEKTLIERLIGEGVDVATMLLAVAGADVDRLLRRGGAERSAFAFVFHSADQVRRYAERGREVHERRAREQLEERRRELQQRAYERGQWLTEAEARALAEQERATGRGPWARRGGTSPANDGAP